MIIWVYCPKKNLLFLSTKWFKKELLISNNHILPLYQALKSITGSGKTVILAEKIEL
jgi:hypothetical protein